MKPDAAWPGRVFEWVENGTEWRPRSETLYVCLSRWIPPGPDACLKVLVLHTTYRFHDPGKVTELRPNDRMWVEAKRIA